MVLGWRYLLVSIFSFHVMIIGNISRDFCLPKNEFSKAVDFVLNSILFAFNNIIYKQNYGTPINLQLYLLDEDLIMRWKIKPLISLIAVIFLL